MMTKRFKSIQSSMTLAFSTFFILFIIGMDMVNYNLAEDMVYKISMENTDRLVDQAYRNILSYIQYMKHISTIVYNNKDVQEYLADYNTLTPGERVYYRDKIVDFIRSIQQTRTDINLIMIFGYRGGMISNRDKTPIKKFINYTKQAWYINAQSAGGYPAISPSHIQNFFNKEYRWVVSLSREIRSQGRIPLGILLVDLNFDIISDICNNMMQGKNGYFFIVDHSGRIIYHPQQQLIYSEIKKEMINKVITGNDGSFTVEDEGIKKIYTVKSSLDPDWKIVGVTYLNALIENRVKIQSYYLILALISVFFIILISLLLSRRISKPIKSLRLSMKKVEVGNFAINIKEKIERDPPDEIGDLAKDFNIMISKIKELMSQILSEQEQKRDYELKALQAQINPHFLYNTLDSIIWLAANNKSGEVLQITSALAKLFRIGISKGEQFITVEEEIEHVKSYLTIQKMRYKDKFDYCIDVDPSIMPFKTIKIILQPFVENAIYHGIKNKPGHGKIDINGRKEKSGILFEIIDDGIGMTQERIQEVFYQNNGYSENRKNNPASLGVGVVNVSERIRLYFGDKYGLNCHSSNGYGTRVDIYLPVLKDKPL